MNVEVCGNLDDIPGARLPVVRQVHIVLVIVQGQAHLIELKINTQFIKSLAGNIQGANKVLDPPIIQNVAYSDHFTQKL